MTSNRQLSIESFPSVPLEVILLDRIDVDITASLCLPEPIQLVLYLNTTSCDGIGTVWPRLVLEHA